MKVFADLCEVRMEPGPVVLAAGFFDGLHRGHRKVIGTTLTLARNLNGRATVLTFDTHPLQVVAPAAAPPLLTPRRHKLHLLEEFGLDGCLLLPFSRDVAGWTAETFVARLASAIPDLRCMVVGSKWRFGNGGRGNPARLSRLGRFHGFSVKVVRPVLRHGQPVSSTRIRQAVRAGHLDDARDLLDRPFSLFGTVVRGCARGRKLGFRTANVDYENEVFPPPGAYAARASFPGRDGSALAAVANLGFRPTFASRTPGKPLLEVHLLDHHGDCYGRQVEVFLLKRLREEKAFASPAQLRGQIARDVEQAREAVC